MGQGLRSALRWPVFETPGTVSGQSATLLQTFPTAGCHSMLYFPRCHCRTRCIHRKDRKTGHRIVWTHRRKSRNHMDCRDPGYWGIPTPVEDAGHRKRPENTWCRRSHSVEGSGTTPGCIRRRHLFRKKPCRLPGPGFRWWCFPGSFHHGRSVRFGTRRETR